MALFELVIFLLAFHLLFLSCVGHGFLFSKILKINDQYSSIGLYGIFGIVALTFYSYLTILITPHNIFFNLIIHIIGIFCFFFYFKNFKFNYKSVFIVLLLSIALIISKNHDDFAFYHLQQSLNFSLNKFQIGLSNLDFFYAYHSSLLYLNSLFYLPYFKYNLFNGANLIIYISAILFFLQHIFLEKKEKFLNFYALFAFVYITAKFSRLSEFGTDLGGQLIVILIFFLTIEIFTKKKFEEKSILITLLLIIYCITIKTYFILYSILALFIIYKYGIINSINLLKKNLVYSIIIILFCILFVGFNILTTGCAVFPLADLCLQSVSWSMPITEVDDYRRWFEIWSKSLAGPNYLVKDYNIYLDNFKWINFWLENYFPKFIENVLVLFFIALIFIFVFRPTKLRFSKLNNNIYFIYSIVFFILLFWFFKHPALRYGGYVLVFLFITIPLSNLISSTSYNFKKISKFSSILIIISLSIFAFKNITRINNELTRLDEYKFDNFPYFYVADVLHEKVDLGNQIYIYKPIEDACWATPSPCGSDKNLNAKKKLGFIIFSRKN